MGLFCGSYTMTATPEWYNAMFFGCPARDEKNGYKIRYNSRFADIIPCTFSPRKKEDSGGEKGFPETNIYFCVQKC